MSEFADRGITVTEYAAMDQAVDFSSETTAVFLGRARRGPLNTPVRVDDPGDFKRRFGGTWSRSGLGLAVEQFFEHGGRRLFVVRVANNARGALLCLPAAGSALVLRAREPGSAERLRAAVDYDGLTGDFAFNLTLQRVDRESGLILDQEIYRGIDCVRGSDAFVGDVLADSSLVCLEPPFPAHRPDLTNGLNAGAATGYVDQAEDGRDGSELSDYDLVGSPVDRTGLFALNDLNRVDLLYLPPPARDRDLGPPARLAAEIFCRGRNAMLIVDPPVAWADPPEALRSARGFDFASANRLTYFPRMQRRDDGEPGPRAVGGAIAGRLCKLDRIAGPWCSLDRPGLGLSRRYRPLFEVDEYEARALVRAGVNVIATGPVGRARLTGGVTAGRGGAPCHFRSLSVQRFCLRLVAAVEEATRWAIFAAPESPVLERVRAQVEAALTALGSAGALADSRILVQTEYARRQAAYGTPAITIRLLFRPAGLSRPVALSLHQSARGIRSSETAFGPAVLS